MSIDYLLYPILKNDVALPNFTKCGGIGHKLNED